MFSLLDNEELWISIENDNNNFAREYFTNRIVTHIYKNNFVFTINTLSGAVDIFTKKEWNSIESAKKKNSFSKLSEKLYDYLITRGYLYYNKEDEEQSFKFLLDTYREQRKIEKSAIIPTSYCNFRCSYCFETKSVRNQKEVLSKTKTISALDFVKKRIDGSNQHLIEVFGGEPLLLDNSDTIKQILDCAKDTGSMVSFITNGYYLMNYIAVFKKYPEVKLHFTVTIDGIENTHKKKRIHEQGKPTFNRIVSGIDALIPSKNINITIRQNIDKEVASSFNEFINWIKRKNWHKKHNIYFQMSGLFATYDKRCKQKINFDAVEVYNLYKECILSDPDLDATKFNTTNYSPESSYLASIFDYKVNGIHTRTDQFTPKISYCHAVDSKQYVYHADGYIYNCLNLSGNKKFSIGRYNNNEEILFDETIQNWEKRTLKNLSDCYNCKFATLCAGGCAADIMWKEGEILKNSCNLEIKENLLNIYIDDFLTNKLTEYI